MKGFSFSHFLKKRGPLKNRDTDTEHAIRQMQEDVIAFGYPYLHKLNAPSVVVRLRVVYGISER